MNLPCIVINCATLNRFFFFLIRVPPVSLHGSVSIPRKRSLSLKKASLSQPCPSTVSHKARCIPLITILTFSYHKNCLYLSLLIVYSLLMTGIMMPLSSQDPKYKSNLTRKFYIKKKKDFSF